MSLPWCFTDEASDFTELLLDRLTSGEEVVVPAHWPVEILSGVVNAKRRGRITEDQVLRFLRDIASFKIQVDELRGAEYFTSVRQIAERHRLTAYDAAYLELAIRSGLPLATLDYALRKAAVAEKVVLL